MGMILRDPARHTLRQHGFEGVVAAPEMVIKRRRGMKRNQAEENEPNRLMYRQELLGEQRFPLDQRRQLAEEEHVRPLAVRIGLEKPKDRLG